MKTLTRITFDPAVTIGKPCLRGLRVTGGTMVGLVAAGHFRQEGREAEPMGSVSLWRSPMARRLVLALLLAAATVARANTPLTITVHPGARQTFQGFGASFVESPGPYGRISQADRDTLARLVWHDCRFRILQKYWYYQQLSQTFDAGAVFRHSTSSLGDPEMTWTYGKKPKLIAAAARNADDTWAMGVANSTHPSFTDRRDNDDQHGFPAETFDVTVVIDELRAAGDLTLQVHRSNRAINNRPAGTVILTQGRVTLRDVAPCDLITLRASRSRGVEESRNSSTKVNCLVQLVRLWL